jgi:hypothetical protein
MWYLLKLPFKFVFVTVGYVALSLAILAILFVMWVFDER